MDWHVLWEYHEALWHAFALTILISAFSIVGSFTVGTCAGCVGALPEGVASRLVAAYIELMRNLPAVIILFFFYFIVGMDAITASILSLTLHHSAYIADVTAAGFKSVSREQFEAGVACGHSYVQIFYYILIPQAIRNVFPSLTSQFIAVIKNSALCMLVGVEDLTWQTQEIASSTFRGFEAATAVTFLYLLIAVAVAVAMTALRRYLLKPLQS
jgi:polar amino acid transport system permease protein